MYLSALRMRQIPFTDGADAMAAVLFDDLWAQVEQSKQERERATANPKQSSAERDVDGPHVAPVAHQGYGGSRVADLRQRAESARDAGGRSVFDLQLALANEIPSLRTELVEIEGPDSDVALRVPAAQDGSETWGPFLYGVTDVDNDGQRRGWCDFVDGSLPAYAPISSDEPWADRYVSFAGLLVEVASWADHANRDVPGMEAIQQEAHAFFERVAASPHRRGEGQGAGCSPLEKRRGVAVQPAMTPPHR